MTPRGRGCGGSTPTQSLRPGLMYNRQTLPLAVTQSVDTHRDQLCDHPPPVLDKLADSLSGLMDTMSTLAAGSDARESRARDSGERLSMSGRKFDSNKLIHFNGLCELGPLDEYWLRPGAWTRKFRTPDNAETG